MIQPTVEEAAELSELREVGALTDMNGWRHIRDFLNELVGEADADLKGNLSGDPMVSHGLRIRYQQRDAVAKAILIYVETAKQQYADKLEEIRGEQNGNTDEHALA